MKIGRRSFLSLIVGGAAGTALTPMSLKLTDDIAIWTQSFKGFPNEVPVPKDGAATYEKSVCTLCPGGCGISVRKIGDRAVKIEGQTGHPVNNGGLCNLGLSGLQLLYGPWRVKSPLKKVDDKWQEISWKQALSEISGKLGTIREKGQAHQVAGLTGSSKNTVGQLLERFLTAFGSPNFFALPDSEDALELATSRMLGQKAIPGFDLENSSYVMSFASNLLEGWGSPVRMFQANSFWQERGAELIQVESRLSNTAAKADRWIPINPGTESELALGMAYIIIRDDLYDDKNVSRSTTFGDFKKFLKKNYTPSKVARLTGVDEPTIEKLATDFARASRPLALCGRGNGQTPLNCTEAMAVLSLNLLVGNLNQRGGMFLAAAPDYIKWDAPQQDDIAAEGLSRPRLDGAGSGKYAEIESLPSKLPQIINSKMTSPVQALIVCESNPMYTLPDSAAVKKAFDKIPLVVSLSAYMDDTAAGADYILPTSSYLERYEDIPVTAGLKTPLVELTRPVVKKQFDTHHPGDIILKLASALGGSVEASMPWDNYKACLKETLGNQWRKLDRDGYSRKSESGITLEKDRTFEKIDFSSLTGTSGLAVAAEGNEQEFPLLLIPYDSIRIAGGSKGTPPFMLKTVSDTVLLKNDVLVEINPDTASRYNLAEGRAAVLKTPRGEARVKIHLKKGMVPDVVALPRGLGHVAYDDYLAEKGVNVNSLLGPVEDPLSGLDTAWGIRAKLTKA